jgi:hypothetical protein
MLVGTILKSYLCKLIRGPNSLVLECVGAMMTANMVAIQRDVISFKCIVSEKARIPR